MSAGFTRFQAIVNSVATYFGAAQDGSGNLSPAHTLVDVNGLPITISNSNGLAVVNTPKVPLFVTVSPTVTAQTYGTGVIVGGMLTFTGAVSVTGGGAFVAQINTFLKTSGLAPTFEYLIFSRALATPANYTDGTTLNVASADAPYLIARFTSDPNWSNLGTGGSWTKTSDGAQDVVATGGNNNLYALCVTRSTNYAAGSTSDFSATIVTEPK